MIASLPVIARIRIRVLKPVRIKTIFTVLITGKRRDTCYILHDGSHVICTLKSVKIINVLVGS